MDLDNQLAVVVGGSSGIGLSTAQALAAAGARVIATGRDAGKLKKAVGGLGGQVTGEVLDCCDRTAVDAFFRQVGAIDHLVLAASGGEGAGEFAKLDLQALRRGFDAKFWPQIEAAQASLATLRRGGSITFVTAISARIANPGTAGLGAINGAIEAMLGTLARELQPTRVNAVSPGVIDTPWWNQVPADFKERVFREQRETLPAGRVGHPQDIAHAVRFLVENSFMTGAVIECDGGMRLL